MKLNNEVHEMKNKYYILDSHYKNANTPEFGFGDFPQKTRYVKCIVFAETKRKALSVVSTPNGGESCMVYKSFDLIYYDGEKT